MTSSGVRWEWNKDWYPTWYPTPIWYLIHNLVPHLLSGIPSTIRYPIYVWYLICVWYTINVWYTIPVWYPIHVWYPIPSPQLPSNLTPTTLPPIWPLLQSGQRSHISSWDVGFDVHFNLTLSGFNLTITCSSPHKNNIFHHPWKNPKIIMKQPHFHQ